MGLPFERDCAGVDFGVVLGSKVKPPWKGLSGPAGALVPFFDLITISSRQRTLRPSDGSCRILPYVPIACHVDSVDALIPGHPNLDSQGACLNL